MKKENDIKTIPVKIPKGIMLKGTNLDVLKKVEQDDEYEKVGEIEVTIFKDDKDIVNIHFVYENKNYALKTKYNLYTISSHRVNTYYLNSASSNREFVCSYLKYYENELNFSLKFRGYFEHKEYLNMKICGSIGSIKRLDMKKNDNDFSYNSIEK